MPFGLDLHVFIAYNACMVTLIHATTAQRLAGIRLRGLLPSKASGRRQAVWLAAESMDRWAVEHVLGRGHKLTDLVLLTVEVPADWIRGFRHDGLFYCMRRIPPTAIRRVTRFAAVVEEVVHT